MEYVGIILLIAFFVIIFKAGPKPVIQKYIQKLWEQRFISWEQALKISSFETEERVKKWLKNKLITSEQADLILNQSTNGIYQATEQEAQSETTALSKTQKAVVKNTPSTPVEKPEKTFHISVIMSICYLGVGIILLGIIALIAANYDKIPPAVRAMSTLLGLTAVAGACFYTQIKEKKRAFEILLVAGVGLIGANIATISQWFQLSGNPFDALFVWSVLAFCFIVFSRKKFWSYLWYPTVLGLLVQSTYAEPLWRFVTHCIPTPVAGMFGCLTLYLLAKKIAPKHFFTEALKIYSVTVSLVLCGLSDFNFSIQKEISFPITMHTGEAIRSLWALVVLAAYPIYTFRKDRLVLGGLLGVFGLAFLGNFILLPALGILMTLFILLVIGLYASKSEDVQAFYFVAFAAFLRLLAFNFQIPVSGMFAFATLYLIASQVAPKQEKNDFLKFGCIAMGVVYAAAFDIMMTSHRDLSFPIFKDSGNSFRGVIALLISAAYPIFVFRKKKLILLGMFCVLGIACLTAVIRIPVLGIGMTLLLLSGVAAYMAKKDDLKAFNIVLLLMFIRLLLAYFHLFASLATTGVGLIILGILILVGVWAYSKLKNFLFRYLKEKI